MIGLCMAAGAAVVRVAATAVVLSWTPPGQPAAYTEDVVVAVDGLRVVQVRQPATPGEPGPPGAVLADGRWQVTPDLPLLPELELDPTAVEGAWRVCAGPSCQDLLPVPGNEGVPWRLYPCELAAGVSTAE